MTLKFCHKLAQLFRRKFTTLLQHFVGFFVKNKMKYYCVLCLSYNFCIFWKVDKVIAQKVGRLAMLILGYFLPEYNYYFEKFKNF